MSRAEIFVFTARSSATCYTYDGVNRLQTRRDQLNRTESYTYDADGNLVEFDDRRAKVATFAYDGLDRRKTATFGVSGSSSESSLTYFYDKASRLQSIQDALTGGATTTITRAYDDVDELTCDSAVSGCTCAFPTPACASTQAGVVSYSYDDAGRRKTLLVGGTSPVASAYCYDDANRLTNIGTGAGCTATPAVTIAYDSAGRRSSVTLPNGVQEVYNYDDMVTASHVSSIQYKNGSTVLGGLTYGYDAAGNRNNVSGQWAKTGLPAAIASTAIAYDDANELTRWNGATLVYDGNGNVQNDGTNTYTWNARNQLASVSGPLSETFQYDAFGRRTQRGYPGFFPNDFAYDGLNPVTVTTAGSTVGLLTGLGIDEYFAATDSSGTKAFLIDALGSTLALVDPASPPTQPQYTYEPFGQSSNSGGPTLFQFTGRENDGTGLYYYRARYYAPTWGRFVSEDPIGFGAGDTNLYRYVFDDPVTFVDPKGKGPLLAGSCACYSILSAIKTGREIRALETEILEDFKFQEQKIANSRGSAPEKAEAIQALRARKFRAIQALVDRSVLDIYGKDVIAEEGVCAALTFVPEP